MSSKIVRCSHCQTAIRWPAGASAARCPSCQNVIRQPLSEPVAAAVPAPNAVSERVPTRALASTTAAAGQRLNNPGTSASGAIALKCPGCKQTLKVGSGSAGKQVRCPHCEKILRVPSVEATASRSDQPSRPTVRPVMRQPSPQPAAVTWPADSSADPWTTAPQPAFAGVNPYQPVAFGSTTAQSRAVTGDFSSDIKLIKRVCWIAFGLGFVPVLNVLVIVLAILVAIIGGNVGAIWLLIRAFQIDTTQGLLVMFVPFYQVYFAVKYYRQVREPALTMALSILPLCVAFVSSVIALGVMTLIQMMLN